MAEIVDMRDIDRAETEEENLARRTCNLGGVKVILQGRVYLEGMGEAVEDWQADKYGLIMGKEQ
jgi:hypothetical protein